MIAADVVQSFLETYANEQEQAIYLARVSDDSWQIIFDNELSLLAVLDTDGGQLGLVVSLGEPSEERRPVVYEALLTYSSLWKQTGGVRGALDGTGGALLIAELPLQNLSSPKLGRAIESMYNKASAFKTLINPGRSGGLEASADQLVTFRL